MSKPSYKAPGRKGSGYTRPAKLKYSPPRTPPSSGGGGGKKGGCFIVAVPAVALIAVCAGLLIHAP